MEGSYRHFFFVSICRPFVLAAQEPIIQALGLYMAFIYGIIYCESCACVDALGSWIDTSAVVLATIPQIFTNVYHETPGFVGLHYISLGLGQSRSSTWVLPCILTHPVGLWVCSQINSRLLDIVYRKLKERNGGVGEPEFRLRE